MKVNQAMNTAAMYSSNQIQSNKHANDQIPSARAGQNHSIFVSGIANSLNSSNPDQGAPLKENQNELQKSNELHTKIDR